MAGNAVAGQYGRGYQDHHRQQDLPAAAGLEPAIQTQQRRRQPLSQPRELARQQSDDDEQQAQQRRRGPHLRQQAGVERGCRRVGRQRAAHRPSRPQKQNCSSQQRQPTYRY
ncbi:MAG: hypothetical protein V9H69_17435 [Anaerolineae bacterium]